MNLLAADCRQVVDHVHFHVIPKPAEAGDKAGLVIGWPSEWIRTQGPTASMHMLTFALLSPERRESRGSAVVLDPDPSSSGKTISKRCLRR